MISEYKVKVMFTAPTAIRAIKKDPHFHGGDFYDKEVGPVEGMGIARRIAHLTYRTEAEMDVCYRLRDIIREMLQDDNLTIE